MTLLKWSSPSTSLRYIQILVYVGHTGVFSFGSQFCDLTIIPVPVMLCRWMSLKFGVNWLTANWSQITWLMLLTATWEQTITAGTQKSFRGQTKQAPTLNLSSTFSWFARRSRTPRYDFESCPFAITLGLKFKQIPNKVVEGAFPSS